MAGFFRTYLTALGFQGAFYRRPLAGSPVRYGDQVVGVNKLKNMMKIICERGGLKGNYSNHSGKRTCATQLYMAGVDEQEIMSRTGHRSEKSVRKYKQSCVGIQKRVASILDPPPVQPASENEIPPPKKLCIESEKSNPSVLQDVSNKMPLCINVSFNMSK